MRSQILFFCLILGLFTLKSFAGPQQQSWRDEDKRRGYVDKVERDNEEPGVPLFYAENPNQNEVSLRDQIFDVPLTNEFSRKYRDTFGRTDAETFYTRSNVAEYYVVQGKEYSQEQYFQQQKSFANYMVRRTAEYHFDSKGRNNPVTNTVIQTKEKMSNIKFAVAKNIRFKAKYSISANDLGIVVDNPWVKYNVSILMDHQRITTMNLGRALDKNYHIESFYTLETGQISLLGRKQLNTVASVNLTYSPNFIRQRWDGHFGRESLLLSGVTWVF